MIASNRPSRSLCASGGGRYSAGKVRQCSLDLFNSSRLTPSIKTSSAIIVPALHNLHTTASDSTRQYEQMFTKMTFSGARDRRDTQSWLVDWLQKRTRPARSCWYALYRHRLGKCARCSPHTAGHLRGFARRVTALLDLPRSLPQGLKLHCP